MEKIKIKNGLRIFKHLAISLGVGMLLIILFFYVYLPLATHHAEKITVPDITGMDLSELNEVLLQRGLRYEVNSDSGYSDDHDPLVVLDQFPKPLSQVKENRKIYITLNAEVPPLVKMPNLLNKSLKIAQISLKSYGLKIGKTEYIPDIALNSVLDQYWKGKAILPGEKVPVGSFIDLKVGDGYGKKSWRMFQYVDMTIEDAKISIVGAGLKLGEITYTSHPLATVFVVENGDTLVQTIEVELGKIIRQFPSWNTTVKLGDKVDLWIYQPDTIVKKPSLLN